MAADGDRIEDGPAGQWRAPFEMIRGGQPEQVTAKQITKRLASYLRKTGNLSSLMAMTDIVKSAASHDLSPNEAYRALLQVRKSSGGRIQEVMLAQSAQRLLTEWRSTGEIAAEPHKAIAKGFLDALLGRELFGFVNDQHEVVSRVKDEIAPTLQHFATLIADNPERINVRDLPVRYRISTNDILGVDITQNN